ncbi:hypothetical protein AGMMS49579_11340 [Spirochaetia bacterium]|nr:hypothetical protein AGMMS49579_11340 [Spirochaetia bacterium]
MPKSGVVSSRKEYTSPGQKKSSKCIQKNKKKLPKCQEKNYCRRSKTLEYKSLHNYSINRSVL